MKKEEIQPIYVGQTLYREIYNRNTPAEIREVTVGRIGKKYFYLTQFDDRYPIGKENLRYENKDYSQSNFQLYRTKQEILDRNEKERLIISLRKHFDWSGSADKSTLEQLRQAYQILIQP